MLDMFHDNKKVGVISLYINEDKNSLKFETYFTKEMGLSEESFTVLMSKIPRTVTLLKYIDVSPEFRGQGIATIKIKNLINNAEEGVVLVCELHTDWLLSWYERLGFVTIGYSNSLPILFFAK